MSRPARTIAAPARGAAGVPPLSEPWLSLKEAYFDMQRERARVLVEVHLTPSEYLVLSRCAVTPPRASEVAREVGITPSGATDLIDRLERRHLVCRVEDPKDRRAVRIRSTPAGERLRRAAQIKLRAVLYDLHSHLTGADRSALTRGLTALTRALADRSGKR